MARAKEFAANPNPAMVLIAKVLEAVRGKQKLSDQDRYEKFAPGEHHMVGTLNYDIVFTKGLDSIADRAYGTPIDTILLLAFHYAGALRGHFVRAAMVCKEIRLAELEGAEDEEGNVTPRPYHDVTYTFKNVVPCKGKRKHKIVVETITIPADEIAAEADRLAMKLTGLDEEATQEAQELRELFQEQIKDCQSKLKVPRNYEGPINLEDVRKFQVIPGLPVEGQQEAAA